MRTSYLATLLLTLGALLAPSVAVAQSQEVLLDASARAFFKQGVVLADEGQVAQASDRFRRALAIRYSPVIAYNLASMLDGQGELLEACSLLHRVEADEAADESLRSAARSLVSEVEPKLASLTVQVDGSVVEPVVRLDDIQLIDVQIGAPIPVDPRLHTLRLLSRGIQLDAQQLALGPSEHAELTLHAVGGNIAPEQVAANHMRQQGQERSNDTGRGVLLSPWLWAGVGVVVVGAVIAVGALVLSGGSGGGSQALALP